MKIVGSVALHRPDPAAPVSPLLFDGRIEDIAFERPWRTLRRAAPSHPAVAVLDQLPVPKREAIDFLRPYLEAGARGTDSNGASISTMRGCPYSCRWCSRAVYGESYRRRSPVKVVDEMEGIVARYHPETWWFVDDVFTINHRWLEVKEAATLG